MQVLGVDVGGTNIRTALISPSGKILQQHRSQLDLAASGATAEQLLATLVAEIAPQLHHAQAVGIGFPGFFRGQSGVLAASPNLPALREFPLTGALSERLHCTVEAQNDALCAALGELHFGVAKNCDNLLHITLGTGVGGGLVLHGQAFYGEGGMACEFGHLRVDHSHDARLCGCGQYGCLETMASATAICQRYHAITGKKLSAQAIGQLAEAGNEVAQMVFQQAGEALGIAIAETVKLLDVRHVSISGGVSNSWELLAPSLRASLEARLLPPQKHTINIMRSTLDDQGGILGAASLAMGLT